MRTGDAFGMALVAHHRGQDSTHFVERDDGYLDSMDAGMYFSRWWHWLPTERKAMRWARGRVLDAGCGAGRHAIHLQEKGFKVTGLDDSPLALKVCRERGLKRTLLMDFARVGTLPPGAFDTVLMMCNNFGLFGSPAGAKRLLRALHRVTAPGARILASSNDVYRTRDPYHLGYHRLNRGRGRWPGQIRLRVRFRNIASPWFDYLMVSRGEMKSLVRGTGWKVEGFIGKKAFYVGVLGRAG